MLSQLTKAQRTETAACLLALALLSFTLVRVRTATVRETYRFVQLDRERKKLEEELAALKARWARDTSPRRLEALASQLGLVAPRNGQVLRYESLVAVEERDPRARVSTTR